MAALREATARAPPVPFRVLVVQAEQRSRVPVPLPRDLESHDIRHVYIKPTTPHLNGKVDRSDRVDQQAFNELLDKDGVADDIHLFNDKLREWEDYSFGPAGPESPAVCGSAAG
jgi:hypothetical protein